MTFGLIIFFIILSVIALIIGMVKRNKKIIVISSIGLIAVLMFGIAFFMALGAMKDIIFLLNVTSNKSLWCYRSLQNMGGIK